MKTRNRAMPTKHVSQNVFTRQMPGETNTRNSISEKDTVYAILLINKIRPRIHHAVGDLDVKLTANTQTNELTS